MISSEQISNKGTEIDALVSGYLPKQILIELALDRPTAYENFERKHLHNMVDIKPEHPLKGSIRKYTYYTPQYLLGCVQFQDPYPLDYPAFSSLYMESEWNSGLITIKKNDEKMVLDFRE